MQEIRIELNKTKIVRLFISCLGLAALGLWFVVSKPKFENSIFENETLVTVVGVFSMATFSFLAFLIGKKIPDTKPGMIINDKGITDNSSTAGFGFIAWETISDIKLKNIGTQKFILIAVNDPQQFFANETRKNFRRIYKYNYKKYAAPIALSAINLKISTTELERLINEYLAAYENKSINP